MRDPDFEFYSAEFRFVMIVMGNINQLCICVTVNSSKTLKTMHFTPQCFLEFCFSTFCRKVLFSGTMPINPERYKESTPKLAA